MNICFKGSTPPLLPSTTDSRAVWRRHAWFVKTCTCGDTRAGETANTVPGGAGSQAEAHVSFSRQRVISQLLQILGSEVFVCVACHCILTCRYKSQAGIRATHQMFVCLVSHNALLCSPIRNQSSHPHFP